jgi:Holliday junction resolvasome RuvABC ATP-dependent DNA helicase subunit
MGLILVGMPGIEKRLARYPQLYSRIGFAHEYRPLSPDEVTAVLTQRIPANSQNHEENLAHATAVATIVRITAGNSRLVNRLLTQVRRIHTINQIETLTPEVVDAARETLLIGH